MPSTPLICSSIGVATVSAMTLGFAPGYCARTTTDGGTTSGYSEIGIARSASRPATKMSTDSTPAKIGRSMKNLDGFIVAPLDVEAAASAPDHVGRVGRPARLHVLRSFVHADGLRSDQSTRADPLQPVDHDALAGAQTARHHPQALDRCAERDLAVFRLALG